MIASPNLPASRLHPLLSGLTVVGAQALGQGLAFARNVLLARLLLPEQFGLVVSLITVATMFQMAADFALDKYLIRNAQVTENGRLRDALHALGILRGLSGALIVGLASPLIAHLLGAAANWPLFAFLGLALAFRGFEHLDYKLAQREGNFRPEACCVMVSQAAGVVAAALAVLLLRGPVAIVIAIDVQWFAFLVATHWVARTGYAARWDRQVAQSALISGFPLMVSAWLAFAAMQGDRLVVAAEAGLRELGAYGGVALIFGSVYTLLMGGVSSVAFPIMARSNASGSSRGDAGSGRPSRSDVLRHCAALNLAIVCAVFVPLCLGGPLLARQLLGAPYRLDGQIACQLGMAFALAFYRSHLNTCLLAQGRNGSVLMINALRALGVVAGALAVHGGYGLLGLTASMVMAELAGCVLSLRKVAKALPDVATEQLAYLAACALVLALVWGAARALGWEGAGIVALGAALSVMGPAAALSTIQPARAFVRRLTPHKRLRSPASQSSGRGPAMDETGLCHGCGGCVAIAPKGAVSMGMTDSGYLRPEVLGPLPENYAERVKAICSGRALTSAGKEEGARRHADWGRLISVDLGHACDPSVRFRGSSGGVLTAIALHLLESGAVDFVVQTRADPDDPLGNVTMASHDARDVLLAAGSRYAPSSPLADIERYLASGRRFAFVGKPCDVATLRAMGRSDPRIAAQVPYMVSFFCAGVPSRHGALALARRMGLDPAELASFHFRGMGWPGDARGTRQDGTEERLDYARSWGEVLSGHLQFRCKICPDGIGEFADIVAADAWHGEGGYPSFAERDGRNLVIARSKVGRALLDAMRVGGQLELEAIAPARIAAMQPYQQGRRRAVLARCLAMRVLGYQAPRYRGLALWRSTLRASPLWLMRNFLGTLRRLPRLQPGA